MLIDIPLLKLRYEILNVSLEELAADVGIPVSTLAIEAHSWNQWWPTPILPTPLDSCTDTSALPTTTSAQLSSTADSSEAHSFESAAGADLLDEYDPLLEEEESELETGSQAYLRDMGIRLQVFNMAKEVYMSHKYAGLEATLIDKAREAADGMTCLPQDLKYLSSIFKDLAANMSTGKSMSVGVNDDGLPTVIIRDLRGREPK